MTTTFHQVRASKLVLPLIRPLVSIFTYFRLQGEQKEENIEPGHLCEEIDAMLTYFDKTISFMNDKLEGREHQVNQVHQAITALRGCGSSGDATVALVNNLTASLLAFSDGFKQELSIINSKMQH